ncbi:hypothetical protein RJO76_002854 [Aeromonas veronii]|nr:hypothetical protein [Aeromonas veronii]
MSTIEVSKLVNIVDFKLHNKNYNDCLKKIRKMAGAWNVASTGFSKAMAQGKKAATGQQKAISATTRAEIRQQRTRKATLRADNIKFKDTLNQHKQFKAELQAINASFLKGTLSFKERSARVGQLTKQYRQLNSQAATHNRLSGVKGIVGRAGSSALTAGVVGAGVIGAGGFATQQGFNSVKSKGQQFEQLDIILNNVFKERAVEISNRIATLANKNGRDILDLGNSLVEFAALMKPLGNTVDDSLTIFQKYQDMIATYGLDKEQSKGFMTQWSQALSQNTLDSYLEAMRQWNPQLKANFETWIKDKKGINDFLDNITGGKKYNLKKMMDEYLTANSGHYAQGAAGYKKSSMSNDARASNSVSVALYRIFESSGFQRAMESASNIVRYWGNLLETNAGKIGEIFGNLYSVAQELSNDAFKGMDVWLKEITAQDIKQYFGDLKTGISDFVDVLQRLVSFLDSVLPEQFKQQIQSSKEKDRSKYNSTEYGKAYVEEERRLLNQGFTPNDAAIRAEQFALSVSRIIQPPQLSFTPHNAPTNYVMRSSQNAPQAISNLTGKLVLDVEANVKQQGFSDFVDLRINDNNLKILNVWE